MTKKRRNKSYVKDYVYLIDFFVNVGVLILIFLKSYEISGTIMGGILKEGATIIIFFVVVDILVIVCQLLYMAGRLRRKTPDDMTIVSQWPNAWICGKVIIMAAFIAAHFLKMDLVSLLFSV